MNMTLPNCTDHYICDCRRAMLGSLAKENQSLHEAMKLAIEALKEIKVAGAQPDVSYVRPERLAMLALEKLEAE